jgi:hypothetical protein
MEDEITNAATIPVANMEGILALYGIFRHNATKILFAVLFVMCIIDVHYRTTSSFLLAEVVKPTTRAPVKKAYDHSNEHATRNTVFML